MTGRGRQNDARYRPREIVDVLKEMDETEALQIFNESPDAKPAKSMHAAPQRAEQFIVRCTSTKEVTYKEIDHTLVRPNSRVIYASASTPSPPRASQHHRVWVKLRDRLTTYGIGDLNPPTGLLPQLFSPKTRMMSPGSRALALGEQAKPQVKLVVENSEDLRRERRLRSALRSAKTTTGRGRQPILRGG